MTKITTFLEFDGVTILTGNEAEAILMKNKQLQEANFQLEEQMRALQKNQIQIVQATQVLQTATIAHLMMTR